MSKYILSIDIGSSGTKYIIMKVDNDNITLHKKDCIYDVPFDKLENCFIDLLKKENIDVKDTELVLTGISSQKIKDKFLSLTPFKVDEYTALSYGVLLLEKLDKALIVSVGTGTCFVYSDLIEVKHIGGTGLGGGAIYGISKKVLDKDNLKDASNIIEDANLKNTDVYIKDLCDDETLIDLKKDLTASNLTKINKDTTDKDFVLGLYNAICQNIGIEAIFSRDIVIKEKKLDKKDVPIVFIGGVTEYDFIKKLFSNIAKDLEEDFKFVKEGRYTTAIGAYEYYLLRERKNF